MDKLEKVYTKEDVAKMLRVTPRTIHSYIKSGKLNAKKLINKRVFITEEDLNEFIDKYVKDI